jgi:tryptophan-rich sensory protein
MEIDMKKFLTLFLSILICLLAGGIGTIFTFSAIPTWYVTLNKPVFSPPNYLFGPVWTILYILMGTSFYLIYIKGLKTKKVRDAIYLFGIQLVLNAIWSPVFFGLKNTLLALFIIVVMWFYILRTMLAFEKIDRKAAILLVPYILWVSFATILNFSVWFLNR